MKDSIIALRKEAERAVHDMSDGDLKTKAFEVILAHLLSGGAAPKLHNVEKGQVAVEPEKPTKAPDSLAERVLSLKADGFFDVQRSIADIRAELKKNGWHYPVTSMSGPLQSLVQKRHIRRERAKDDKGRIGWKYSNP
jgi:hypothetical protein